MGQLKVLMFRDPMEQVKGIFGMGWETPWIVAKVGKGEGIV